MTEFFNTYTGHIAGVATSLLWTATALLFTAAGRRLGSVTVNSVRIVLATILLGATLRLFEGTWCPSVTSSQLVFLALSGIVGLSFGDQALFTAFVDIGPRLSMLIMTTSPLIAAVLGFVILGETLSLIAIVGMILTVFGVAWVVLERRDGQKEEVYSYRMRGFVLAFIGAACQAGGLLLSKMGIGHGVLAEDQHISALAATFIRMAFAIVGVVPIVVLHSLRSAKLQTAGVMPNRVGSPRVGYICLCCATIVGPFLGVWMSLVASDHVDLGVAQTLVSLTPIFILAPVAIIHKERVSLRATIGAFIAVAGAALLFIDVPS